MSVVIGILVDAAVELNVVEIYGPGYLPGIAYSKPVIWCFNLGAINYLLWKIPYS
jgi:hypothetical protein